MTIKLALLGSNISHSQSPVIYRRLISNNIEYDLLDISEVEQIPSWHELAKKYQGLNITTPWKEVFADKAVKSVAHLGAVNCLRFNGNDCEATNTDWSALKLLLPAVLKKFNCEVECVLLGNGVMARITTDVCSQLSVSVTHYARSLGNDLAGLKLENTLPGGKQKLIINACGRSVNFQASLRGAWVFWDLNYAHTAHEKQIPSDNTTYLDGRELLEEQAKHAIQFWNLSLPH